MPEAKVLKEKVEKKTIGEIVFFFFALLLLLFFWPELKEIFANFESIRQYIQSFGTWGPIVLIFFSIFQVIVWPIPGYLPVAVGAYLYGLWGGFLYTLIGINIGTYIVLFLSRRYGRPFVERIISKENLAKWDNFLGKRGSLILFFIFLTPGFPDDLIVYVAGLTKIPIPVIIVLSIIGRSPQNLNISYFGEAISLSNIHRLIIPIIIFGAAGAIGLVREQKLVAFFDKMVEKIKK